MLKLFAGEIAPKTGTYTVIGQNGHVVASVYVKEGSKMPPTQSADCHFEIEE